MSREKSVLKAYILNGDRGGYPIDWEGLKNWTPAQGVLWVHLDFSAKKSQEWLRKSSGLEKLAAHALFESETRPRSVLYKTGLLVVLRGVNLNPGKDPEDMISVRIWLDEHRIITTSRHHLLPIQDLESTITESQGPRTNSECLIMLNDYLINRIGDVVDTLETEVDDLEQDVLLEESYSLRPKISELRRQAILIRRYLAPQREALYRLQMEESPWLTADDRMHIRESNERIIRFIEDLDAARDRAAVTQEELSSKLSEQIDRRMYILSLVAVIFLPLTFLTGLLGINVDGIPGAKYHSAFAIVCAICAGIFAVLYLIFKRNKWF